MKPLEGVTVVDLTHALAGPVCAYQLMLLGAEVIKIEPPGAGDDFRGFAPATFIAVNAGKKSVTLNLKDPRALAVLERLVREADVLVDNFKPGATDKWGLTWERVHGWNEKVIWCSISGFGLEGPWRDKPAVEWSVQGASGVTDSYIADDADPRVLGLGVLDVSTGHAAATSILAALLLRAKTGVGERIDVAMIDVALGLAPQRMALTGPSKRELRPAVGRFMAKDRRLFIMGAHQRWFETISKVLGAPFLADDPRFADPAAREANAEALREAIEAKLATRTAEEWEEALTGAGTPASVVRRTDEVVASPHVRQRGTVHEVAIDGGATTKVPGPSYKMAGVELAPTGSVPALGAHTDAVLGRFGFSADEIAGLRASGVV